VNPSPGDPSSARMRPSDAYFDLISDTLEGLESGARAQFLQRLFLALSQLEFSEAQATQLWDDIQARRNVLTARMDSPVSFQTALVDVLANSGMFRVATVLDYEDLKALRRTAVTDPLTGLRNRRLFDETFDKELNRARRYGQPLSLVMLDLHRFKEVNDKYGHPRGDEVLRAAAATLKKALRTSDAAFRIGGDEFALLLPQTDAVQASALSRRIGVVFTEILRPLELEISVAMDHGVATYPQDGEQRAQLIRISDERLYRSKHASQAATQAEPTVAARPDSTTAPRPEPAPEPTKEPEAAAGPATATAARPSSPAAAESTPTAPVSPEAKASPEAALETPPLDQAKPLFPIAPPEPKLYAVPRKAERVSMVGTNAYAVLGAESGPRARVVDLGFGGVALDFPNVEGLADTLFAVLHVPILPPVRVNLKRVWTRQISEDTFRVGCCFIS